MNLHQRQRVMHALAAAALPTEKTREEKIAALLEEKQDLAAMSPSDVLTINSHRISVADRLREIAVAIERLSNEPNS